ncbi:hypothetical protein FACS189443_5140 [Planctomycetales bacterium]|nr:hypothetical protein FACS189443_5140 [Planctomycetales bacterium]
MSGPKAGTAVVGGGAVVAGAAAVAAVAIPIAAAALVGYGAFKAAQAASNGVNKALAEHEKHKGDMRAEIDSQERPILPLLSNGLSRWQKEKNLLDAARQKAEQELEKLCNSIERNRYTAEAKEAFRKAEELFAEANQFNAKFNAANSQSAAKFAEARNKSGSSKRTVRSIVSEGKSAADNAVGAINAAVESARNAILIYEETLLIIQQKAGAERQEELLRQNARSNIDNAKSEIQADNLTFIQDWLGNESTELIGKHIQQAENGFSAKQYEEGTKLAQEAVAMYRKFYDSALQMKQQFENREIIADALIAALTDLQYDEPDVNYEPKDGIDNAMLGNITLFAKSKGESGDMRLSIDLDGKINLEVENIPEGQEAECHGRLTDLQTKVADTVDFEMTDWGRAKNIQAATKGCVPKQRVQEQEKMKQRGT